MAQNEALEEVVMLELYRSISQIDESLKMVADDSEELGKEIVKTMSETRVDEPHKIRVHFGFYIGYGYDFTKDCEGTSAKKIYERAIEGTKRFGGTPHTEKLVKDGVSNEIYGWYVTSLR